MHAPPHLLPRPCPAAAEIQKKFDIRCTVLNDFEAVSLGRRRQPRTMKRVVPGMPVQRRPCCARIALAVQERVLHLFAGCGIPVRGATPRLRRCASRHLMYAPIPRLFCCADRLRRACAHRQRSGCAERCAC